MVPMGKANRGAAWGLSSSLGPFSHLLFRDHITRVGGQACGAGGAIAGPQLGCTNMQLYINWHPGLSELA